MINFSTIEPSETVEYFTKAKWGRTYEDDKYFKNAELEDNFIIFATYAFAHMNLPRPSKAQYYIALHLCDETKPHRMVWASRGLGKSIFSQLYVCWLLLNNPNEKILVMSAATARAANYTNFVKKLIMSLPILKSMTPRHNEHRTSSTSFDVAGALPSDSPSVYAVGVGTAVTGFRASIIIADDIESSITVESMVKTETVMSQFAESMNLLMSGNDRSIVLSTPHSTSSIYIELIERGWDLLALPAQVPDSEHVYFGGLSPHIKKMMDDNIPVGTAVDERLDKEFLESKKMRIGKSKYNLQYMLDVSESDALRYPLKLSDLIVTDVDDDVAPIKVSYSSMPDNILYQKHNGFAKDKLYMPRYESDETAEYEFRCMSIDTAGLGKDEIGITIIYSLGTRLYLRKVIGLKGGYGDDTMNEIGELCLLHNIHTVVVEDNFGDGMFKKLLEPFILKHSPKTEVEGIKVTGQKEVRIIETLEPLMNQHRLVVSKEVFEHDKDVSPTMYSFGYQLSHITRERDSIKHDDRLDSLANGVAFMIEYLADDENRIVEYHAEQEARKTLEYTLGRFKGSGFGRRNLNYGNNF